MISLFLLIKAFCRLKCSDYRCFNRFCNPIKEEGKMKKIRFLGCMFTVLIFGMLSSAFAENGVTGGENIVG